MAVASAYAISCTGVAPASCRWYEQTLIGFHAGTWRTVWQIRSTVSRRDGSGAEDVRAAADRYSLTMSFCVVPARRRGVDAPLLGEGEVHREQPHGGGVDRHRRVHLLEGDAVEERAHLAEVGDGHADLADLAPGQRVVGVVAGLGGQVEGDRQAGLALGQVGAVELVGRPRRRVARVGPHHPGAVGRGQRGAPWSSTLGGQCHRRVGLLAVVVVEAAARLAAQPLGADHPAQQRRRARSSGRGTRRTARRGSRGSCRGRRGRAARAGPSGSCSRPSWPRRCRRGDATPASSSRTALLRYGKSSAFTMNPAWSRTSTTVLPHASAKARAAAMVSSDVVIARTISTSAITGGGVEEVDPAHPVGAAGLHRHLDDGQRRRVGGEDRARRRRCGRAR